MVIHQVFFWLHNPEDELQSVLAGCKSLSQIKSGRNTRVGLPAATPKRAVVDDSYHIALQVEFEDIEAHDQYQTDPVHLKFIADHKQKWAKVQIYDFEV